MKLSLAKAKDQSPASRLLAVLCSIVREKQKQQLASNRSHFFYCPACSNKSKRITQWDVFTPRRTNSGGLRLISETHSLAEPDPTLQPILHHHATNIMKVNENEGHPKKNATLSLSTIRADKDGYQ